MQPQNWQEAGVESRGEDLGREKILPEEPRKKGTTFRVEKV